MDNPNDRYTTIHPIDQHPIDQWRAELAIDWHQLRQLSEGNEEFELELLHIFATETGLLLQQGQQAILQRAQSPLAHIAHRLKGSSGSIGIHKIAQLAQALEQSARAQDWDNAASQIEQLTRLLTDIQNLLHAP
jgi:HPt (histidine-containing phosphotransfer) domain-containing protein